MRFKSTNPWDDVRAGMEGGAEDEATQSQGRFAGVRSAYQNTTMHRSATDRKAAATQPASAPKSASTARKSSRRG